MISFFSKIHEQNGELRVSREKVLVELTKLGLKKAEAKTYFYLAKKGPKKANEITKALGMTKQQLYPIIKELQSKALVTATLDRPAEFSAISFEKFLDLFAQAKLEEAKIIQQNKGKLLSDWQSIAPPISENISENFSIIKGRTYVYSKIQQMIQETKRQFCAMSNLPDLLRADQFGVFDILQDFPNVPEIRFRIITEVSDCLLIELKNFLVGINSQIRFRARNDDVELSLFPKMVLRDNEEVLYFISSGRGNHDDIICLSTNCGSLVSPFSSIFEELWNKSTKIEEKIKEMETGNLLGITEIIEDPNVTATKFNNVLRNANRNVSIIVSSDKILNFQELISIFRELVNKKVSIKIISPITNQNLKVANELAVFSKIKHVPPGYKDTIIVDDKHLFQFKIQEIDNDKAALNFENTFYTNNIKYVEKSKNLFKEMRKNAQVPLNFLLNPVKRERSGRLNQDPILAPFNILKKLSYITLIEHGQSKTPKEIEIINKIITARKKPSSEEDFEGYHSYTSSGLAVVRLNEKKDLPTILIRSWHFDKKSVFGTGDVLMLHLWLKAQDEYAFVPVAIVHDQPETTNHWKEWMAGTPAAQNVQSIKKDEIEVQSYGKTLFACWTKPIPLIPKTYILPPSTIILRGFGNVITGVFTQLFPSGIQSRMEFNGFEAYVTFIHGKTKYSGSSSVGFIFREALLGNPKTD